MSEPLEHPVADAAAIHAAAVRLRTNIRSALHRAIVRVNCGALPLAAMPEAVRQTTAPAWSGIEAQSRLRAPVSPSGRRRVCWS